MAASEKSIVAFGELLWDILPSGRMLGGAPANFAYRIASFGHKTTLISRLGDDALGREAFERVSQFGLDLSCMQFDPELSTGTVQVTLDEGSGPDYFIVPNVAYDRITLEPDLMDAVSNCDCFCFGTLVQRSAATQETLYALIARTGGLRVVDLNLRKDCFTADTVQRSLQSAQVLKLNDSEVAHLRELLGSPGEFHAFCRWVFGNYPIQTVLITLGAEGVFGATSEGEQIMTPGHKIRVRDTCGSGDAFTAGFVHAKLQNLSFENCLRIGNKLGAIVAMQTGATEPLSREQLADLLSCQ